MILVEANWGNFRAKFNGREQKTFEWMASLFFYREHNHPFGAPRYFNQAGVEAEPITVGTDVIGWQAKFTDRELASYKDQLIASITTAKAQHPALTKIYFYINVDFGQGKKDKDPAYKTEIEAHAASKGVSVTWKTAVFFESPFVCQTHAEISSHFFNLEPSTFDLVRQVAEHGDALLSPIQSKITVGSYTVRLDRQGVVEQLLETFARVSVVILSGDGGVGKTAVVKEFHSQLKDKAPFFVFKASEFNIRNINELFNHYGGLTLSRFIGAHRDVTEKYVVVDSAEKLADIEYLDVFQEFLSALRRDGWKIIFTTRLGYLDDLKYQLVDRYGVPFEPLNVPGLTPLQLFQLASEHGFLLPENERLRSLVQNLFYLKEYLRIYPKGSGTAEYGKFREALWNNEIERASARRDNIHRRRGECFVQIARKRASEGLFYVPMSGHEDALAQLEADEIIKYDSVAGGYFITHDIYEEWALERLVEQAYNASKQRAAFYEEIGDSLPVRRAFRTWLGGKLLSATDLASQLIVSTVEDRDTPRHWKDEALVAVLLSDQAGPLIQRLGRKMLDQLPAITQQADFKRTGHLSLQIADSSLFYQMFFLLRIACKEVDQNMLNMFPEEALQSRISEFFTRPKGPGWAAMIEFAYQHSAEVAPLFFHSVLPALIDWTNHHKTGEATRHAGLMALHNLRVTYPDDEDHRRIPSAVRTQLTTVISNSSPEIKPELTEIFDEVIELKDPDYDSAYDDLFETVLSSIDKSALVAATLPKQVLALANVFWRQAPYVPSHRGIGYRNDLERHFNLRNKSRQDYYASAFRTPLLRLLQVDPQSTVSFILAFVNDAVAYYAKSDLDKNEVEEIELRLPKADTPVKQFISRRLWLMYRSGVPAPSLLSSMHMALEKWLLHVAKVAEAHIAQSWCMYLLEYSRSASTTAVVTSVVFAQPEKLADIAYILLRNRAILQHDIQRMTFEPETRQLYSIANDWDEFFRNERLATCDEEHRRGSLEHIALSYQMFRSDSESEAEAQARQETLWHILDEHYAQLNSLSAESPETKTWRLCLARMDRRKMTISSEVRDDGIQLTFNPELDSDLRTYSEATLATLTDSMRYTGLHLWSRKRWEGNKAGYSQYPQYEGNPKQVIDETRSVYEALLKREDDDGHFFIAYRSIPPTACAALLRDFSAQLEPGDVDFCKEVVLDYASAPFTQPYQYQIGDGVEAAIGALPTLLKLLPEYTDHVKAILLFTLLDTSPITISDRFNSYAVAAIEEIGRTHPEVVDALFSGYLHISPIWKDVSDASVRDRDAGNWYGISHFELIQRLIEEHEEEIDTAIGGGVGADHLPAPRALEPEAVVTAVDLLRLGTTNAHHKSFAIEAASLVIQGAQRHGRDEERFDFKEVNRFYKKFAQLVLHADGPDIAHFMRPILDRLDEIDDADMLFQQFILVEDCTHRYAAFWSVWELLYPEIVKFCQWEGHKSSIVHNYLLAWPYWSKTAKQWDSLKEREKSFFARVATDIGGHPSVLYSLAKFLNEVGTPFVSDGILWISGIVERNPSLMGKKLERNTEYYLENLIRGYVLSNREMIRKTPHVKQAVLGILNFLLERGSVTAYLTREHIL